jgi:Flp pilus assembly protein TadD
MAGKQYYLKGMKLLDEARFKEALVQFNKALDLEPDHPDYLSDRAVTYFHLDKKDLAMIDLNRAQQLDKSNPYRYSSRAFVKDSLGDLDGAIADYRKAIELDPDDAIAHNNLGLLEEKSGYKKQSEERFAKADELMGIQSADKSNKKEFIAMNPEPKKNGPQNDPETKTSGWRHVKYAVFTKSGRKEFFKFIKNGFKLK